MSARREASTPPRIPGYEPVRLLGTGGFADVFLYTQLVPRREVAVKVLLATHLGDEARRRFRDEADLMARLSAHPSIVTVHHADVAPDGRPYLVMEYCSRPGLGARYRAERIAVAEALRIGVRLASAVETAHRAGILHRDIKPANVLVTDFGWPALTDFGIAAATGLTATGAMGMSIPWSPPEMLAEDPQGDERSDVWSLAATVYSLLAGRSPFEVQGAPNTAADLITRIERSPLAPVGRADVPASLDALLARAMAKDPAARLPSALALARGLQQVEAELMLPVTPLDLPEVGGDVVVDDDPDQATRVRPVQVVSPEGPGPAQPSTAAVRASAAADVLVAARDAEVGADGVPEAWRSQADALTVPEGTAPRRRGRRVLVAVSALVVVAAGAGAVALALSGRDAEPEPEPTTTPSVVLPTALAVPAPTDVVGVREGDAVVFTWANPDPQDGDRYTWGVVERGAVAERHVTDEPTATVSPAPGGEVCVEVAVVRADRRASVVPAVGCVD